MVDHQQLETEHDADGYPIHRYQLYEDLSEPLLYLSTNHREYSTEGGVNCDIRSFLELIHYIAEDLDVYDVDSRYAQGSTRIDDDYNRTVSGPFGEVVEEFDIDHFDFLSVRLGAHKLSWAENEKGNRLMISSANNDTRPLDIYRHAEVLPMITGRKTESPGDLLVDQESTADKIVEEVAQIISENTHN